MIRPRVLLLAFVLLGLVVGAADAQDPVAGATQGAATFTAIGAVLAWHLWRSREKDQEHRADLEKAWAAVKENATMSGERLAEFVQQQATTNATLERIEAKLERDSP